VSSGEGFSGSLDEYYGLGTDTESLVYLMLVNYTLHKFYPTFVITIAEVSDNEWKIDSEWKNELNEWKIMNDWMGMNDSFIHSSLSFNHLWSCMSFGLWTPSTNIIFLRSMRLRPCDDFGYVTALYNLSYYWYYFSIIHLFNFFIIGNECLNWVNEWYK